MSRPSDATWTGVLGLILGLIGRSATAQQAVIIGVAKDTAGVPVPYAQALLVRAKRADRATDRGWFVLDSVEAGADLLLVRAIGFQPQQLPITIGATDTLELSVVLSPKPPVLPELTVTANGYHYTGVAAEAVRRMLFNGAPASGLITRPELDRWAPFDLANVFRRAGLAVTNGLARCPSASMTIYVDGLLFAPQAPGVDVEIYPPETIEAIEVYRSIATRPVEFNSTNHFGCLVLIWTRR